MQKYVRIVNRSTYTNPRKAMKYVSRGLASIVSATDDGHITEIRMLESAELALARSANRLLVEEYDPVTGKFHLYVGDSGGSQMMKMYDGISGGYRVWQFAHKTPKNSKLDEEPRPNAI